MVLPQSAVRLYRALLLAYPAEFRNEYGEEMEQLFSDRLSTEPKIRVWAQALADLAASAPREHLHVLAADLRYAARFFAKAPAFTALALTILALGIGASTAVFSLLNAVLLRSLPYGDPGRLVYVWAPNPRYKLPPGIVMSVSNADFFDVQRTAASFARVALFNGFQRNLSTSGAADRVSVAQVTSDFFATLETSPLLGRLIRAEDCQTGRDHEAIISHVLWQSHFGASRDAIGKNLLLDGHPFRVIGVMPLAFSYPHEGEASDSAGGPRTDVWIPWAMSAEDRADRDSPNGALLARLKPGVTVRQAQAEMSTMTVRFDKLKGPDWNTAQAEVQPFLDGALGQVRPLMWLLLGAVSLVLLIACGNVANLLMARAAGRVHEMGVRSALGASRGRLIRQVLTEALLLAVLGGALGVLMAKGLIRVLLWMNPGDIPRIEQTSVDGGVLAFCLLASILSGVLFGLYPALSLSMQNLASLLKQGGTRGLVGTSNRLRDGLIVIEIAVSMILLAGAGLLIRSYSKVQSENVGFAPSALTMNVQLDDRYNNHQWSPFFQNLLAQVRRLPGVESAGVVSHLPLTHSGSISTFEVVGQRNDKYALADVRRVTPGYFQAMGIRVLQGRAIDERDGAGQPLVMMVSEGFADKYVHGRSAVGGQIRMSESPTVHPVSTIVGVVASVRHWSLEEAPKPTIYSSFAQGPSPQGYLAMHLTGDPKQTAASVRAIVRGLDPALAVTDTHTMADWASLSGAHRRFETVLLGAFAGAALLLALIGLYGLITYSVRQRTAEIGIRMALGATRADILRMILRQGLRLAIAGSVLGLVGALASARLLSSWLYQVSPFDPVIFAGVPLLLLAVSTGACVIPALRATQTDPAIALRNE